MSVPNDNSSPNDSRLRQRRIVLTIAPLLIVAGLVVLLFLKRMPLPLRLAVGLADVFTGLVLLVLVRQKFPK